MNNINWVQKLTSRKFWAALIGFITAVMVALGYNDLTIEQVIALVTAMSTLIAYIIGEGMVDAARLKEENLTIGQLVDYVDMLEEEQNDKQE